MLVLDMKLTTVSINILVLKSPVIVTVTGEHSRSFLRHFQVGNIGLCPSCLDSGTRTDVDIVLLDLIELNQLRSNDEEEENQVSVLSFDIFSA